MMHVYSHSDRSTQRFLWDMETLALIAFVCFLVMIDTTCNMGRTKSSDSVIVNNTWECLLQVFSFDRCVCER